MTREQAKQKLTSLGIDEPSDEQVTKYLNTIGEEIKKEKDKAEDYKARAATAEELQRQLDELNSKNLTDIEKANAERDKALKSVEELNVKIKSMELKTGFAELGIIGENADKLIESLNNGRFDTALLGQIIAEKNQFAVSEYEKKNLKDTPNPDGNSANNSKNSAMEKLVKESAERATASNEKILDYYRR